MHRIRSNKPIALTERDMDIFRWLSRYRYLRSSYLHAFVGGASEKRFIERLCDLFHHGFVNRAEQQWLYADARCRPIAYESGPQSRSLPDFGEAGNSLARTFLAPGAHRQFGHALAICACLASIEIATGKRQGIRFIPWPEILARAPEETRRKSAPFKLERNGVAIVPDGIFGLEYRAGERLSYRFFAVEVDRGTMPVMRTERSQTSYAAKLNAYKQLIQAGAPKALLGIPNLFVLTLTTSQQRVSNLLACDSSPFFLFKAAEEQALLRPLPSLLDDAWMRNGLAPLSIAKPQ